MTERIILELKSKFKNETNLKKDLEKDKFLNNNGLNSMLDDLN